MTVVALTATACTGGSGGGPQAAPGASIAPVATAMPAGVVQAPADCVTVIEAGSATAMALAVSRALFSTAPVVVVGPTTDGQVLRDAAGQSARLGAPLLLAAGTTDPTPTAAPAAADGAECIAVPVAEAPATPTPEASPESTSDATPAPESTPTSSPTSTPEPAASFSATPAATPAAAAAGDEPVVRAAGLISEAAVCAPSQVDPVAAESSIVTTAVPEASATPTTTASPTATSTTPSPSASLTPGPTATETTVPDAGATPSAVAMPVLEPEVAAELGRLAPAAVLATTPEIAALLRAALPELRVVENPAELPATLTPAPLSALTVMVPNSDETRAGAIAVQAGALAAGARVIGIEGADPRADSCAITALGATPAEQVLAVGDFGTADELAVRLSAASTGLELPGGGQLIFPGRRLIAMYGYPNAPELGVLGAQGIAASIERVRQIAAPYRALSDVPVVPTFEIITTVAQGSPGSDGDYSAESSVESLLPWITAAAEAGVYVILDLQPGRSDFLSQAKQYEELLRYPHVGLALDPEWRLGPNQVHLRQIGSVDSSEINRVSAWLADLTARYSLPQKVLVLHQFSLGMIRNREGLDTSHDEIELLIHMDGQGEPSAKEGTWRIVTNTVPDEIWMGWKNFYRKDTRVMTPRETLDREPVPVMISYQ
ncbi:MAG: hypothetical protein ACT4P1_07440 [Sporichthyaceae bacterium]